MDGEITKAGCSECNKHGKLYSVDGSGTLYCYQHAREMVKVIKKNNARYADCRHLNTYHGMCLRCGEDVC